MFIEDKLPAPVHTKLNLEYASSKIVLTDQVEDKDANAKPAGGSNTQCFNCDGSHNLKDCPQPRNNKKIQKARQSMGKRNERYHEAAEQKYAKYVPGQLSKNLQRALGLSSRSVPLHIYRMRHYGYSPSWLKEAQVTASTLQIVKDKEGVKDRPKNKKFYYDANKIHDFSGFNVPLSNGQIDEHYRYNAPPMLPMHDKQKFIEYLNSQAPVPEISSDEEVVDMDVESPEERSSSPSLSELREAQAKLITELSESQNDSNPENENSNDAGEVTLIEEHVMNRSSALSTTEGTPLLESCSPYDTLPAGELFSKGVSDVIHFENLPDSTGKYEKMRNVLTKVRKCLTNKMK